MKRLALIVAGLLGGCRAAAAPNPTPVTIASPSPARTATVTSVPDGILRRSRGALSMEDVPETPPELKARLGRYQNTRRADVVGWDPVTRGLYILTRFANATQLHRVDQPLGMRRQLTFFDEPIAEVEPSPSKDRPGVLLSMDKGGDENAQIYWLDGRTKRVTLLTDGTSKNGSMVWSDDSKRVVYTSTRRNQRDFDLWALEPEQGKDSARMIYQAQGQWFPLDWSPSGDRLLVSHEISETKATLHVLMPEQGLIEEINPGPAGADVSFRSAVFSRDGQRVLYVSDAGGERRGLWIRDLRTHQDKLLSPDLRWDVDRLERTADRKLVAVLVNEAGYGKLRIYDLEANQWRPDPPLKKGVIGAVSFSPDGRSLAYTLESGQGPGDAWVLELTHGKSTRWTECEVGGLDPSTFHEPELIEVKSFDGKMIPAFLTRPSTPGPHPVVISIHGGPEAQARPYFSPFWEFLVSELGVAVLTPNVRGSTGYGRAYTLLDNGEKREDSVKDIGAFLDWIQTQPELDASRVAVFGGSYGGFMVLASAAMFPDRIRAAVDVVGISNFVTFLESTKEYRRDLRRVEYGDERVPAMREFLTRISPTTNAHRITAPLFIVQGANDPRVPRAEAAQMAAAVRANKKDVWTMLAADEGHGFQKKENRDAYQEATVLFLMKNLGLSK
ncbi:MAG: alpha/beta fold hydrolase [Myxococcota bacterium]